MSLSGRVGQFTIASGMRGLTIVAGGQAVSLVGTQMTRFAILIWAYEETGRATALALLGFYSFVPIVLLSPVAGALVDRWNRKLVMIASDLGAGLATLVLLGLLETGKLEVWHLYAAAAFAGVFESFQWPAFSAAVTTMVPKKEYARANGMLSLAQASSTVLAPIFAGGLYAIVGLGGILTIDVATFMTAVVALIVVTVPQPSSSEEGRHGSGGLLTESLYGFRFIWTRRPLLALQLVFTGVNLTSTVGWILLPAMVLARTGESATALGTVNAIAGVGGVVGGLLMSSWGGPSRRINGVLGGMIAGGLFGQLVMGVGQVLWVWALGALLSSTTVIILNGCNQAIWQAKVAPDVQGRVFSVRRLIAQVTAPVGMLLAGPLADLLFEPAMMPGGALAARLGPLFGTGPGAGMGVLFALGGIGTALVGLAGYAIPAVRDVETIMPDHDELGADEKSAVTEAARPGPPHELAAAAPNARGPRRSTLRPRHLVATIVVAALVGVVLVLAGTRQPDATDPAEPAAPPTAQSAPRPTATLRIASEPERERASLASIRRSGCYSRPLPLLERSSRLARRARDIKRYEEVVVEAEQQQARRCRCNKLAGE